MVTRKSSHTKKSASKSLSTPVKGKRMKMSLCLSVLCANNTSSETVSLKRMTEMKDASYAGTGKFVGNLKKANE